ncbi:zinc finger protein 892-like [Saccostrea cucullata]|uniref:zinc finger protein 892-like n=1 Tax=Saccostrea cuccullata TaxID=36930 RepID=UPI002ED16BA1
MREEICITASNLSNKLTDVLYLYQQYRILCDCCIQCSDGEVYAHKIILAMWGMYGFYIDTIDTIQALKFSTADVNNFIKLIYSGNSSLNLDATLRVAEVGKLIGIKFQCMSDSPTQEESLESALSALKSSPESGVKLNEKYTLYIKSLPDYQNNFSTTINVRCREPIKKMMHSMPCNHDNSTESITDKGDKNLEECLLSQSSNASSTILTDESKSAESLTTDNKVDFTSEYEKTTIHRAYSDKLPEIVSIIQIKTENLEWPESENTEVKTEQVDSAVESRSWGLEVLKTADNNSVRELSVERMQESLTEIQDNISNRKKESQLDLPENTSQNKRLIECRRCLKQDRPPFMYADTAEGLQEFNRHAIQLHPLAYIENVNCEICGASYKHCQADRYMEHLVKTHGVEYDSTVYQKKTCDNCEYWTLCRAKYKTHQKNVHLRKLSICDVCGEAFKDIKQHRETHKDRPRIPCEICGNTFISLTSIKNHIERVHEKKYKSVGFCAYCNENFIERYKYFKHMFTEHNEIPKGMEKYQCSQCDFVTYQMGLLRTHELKHKELKGMEIERNYKCHECGKAFVTKVKRNNHLKLHHVGTPMLQCHYDGCNKVFKRKQLYQIHIRDVHQTGKIYHCHACPYKCNRQGNLVKHIRSIHKEEVSTRASRRKEAMLSGKGYHEAVGQTLRQVQGPRKSSEGESSLSEQRHWTLIREGVNSDQEESSTSSGDSRENVYHEEGDSRESVHSEQGDSL